MKSLNAELCKAMSQLDRASHLAAEYNEWEVVRTIADAREEIARAIEGTRETAIASVPGFIAAARVELEAS